MEETNQLATVDLQAILPYLLSALAPTILGFLQQLNKTTVEKLPWYAKSIVTALIGALITMLTNYVAGFEASVTAGAVVASIGSVNIALRKGTRANLTALQDAKVEKAVQEFCAGEPEKATQKIPGDNG